MKHIRHLINDNSKYKRFKKPLEAAQICEAARTQAKDRFEVISFRGGLLTLGISSPAAAQNLQLESEKIISLINQKLGQNMVKKLRFKIQ